MPSIKPALPPLKTPSNIVFPSELRTDSSTESARNEDNASTPITPPAAYTEFLKALSPIFSNPESADNVDYSKYRFNQHQRNANIPRSQPSSAVSGTFNFNESARSATLPPPTPHGPTHARREFSNLRRLRIPPALRHSPSSAEPLRSAGPRSAGPRSATIARSPYSAYSPYSPYSPYSYSPADWRMRYLDAPRTANPRSSNHKVSVRHVVTHTVTYTTTELDAPPKGKRRKHGHEDHESDESD